jgi:hypothetical protein
MVLLPLFLYLVEEETKEIKEEEPPPPPSFQTYWELVSWYSRNDYDAAGLNERLKAMFWNGERHLDPARRRFPLPPGLRDRGGGLDSTSRHKLLHDLEQFEFLARTDKLERSERTRELLETTLPRIYRKVLERMDETEFDEEVEYYEFQPADEEIRPYYNRALFLPEFGMEVIPNGVPLLNPAVDFAKIERQWFGEEPGHDHPGIVVIDDLLSAPVLDKVRDYLMMGTFYYDVKTPRYGRYVGAYMNDGMHDKLLMAVAYELHRAMPRVMKGHDMKELWAYKYESSPEGTSEHRTGIHTHADDAAVNVNIWITPDDANLDPTSGGLVVYTAKPPDHWDFDSFNSNWEYVEENLLKPTGFANVTVPYRQNRAVIFDSFLFHKTDNCRFRQGYENRRINLTILYGNREKTSSSSSTGTAGNKEEL